ncbi:MAG: hypothetical protein K9K66_04475 [Desulfarculaceae bacterium]|nr:hypothetical protein [Desulfarculaceae bacterium]MCF8073299.1 hypothetical protein [Desulfarculaceae bacterium]MCF8100895.1 hypothetical protein [Desulfarculaceae bacterium]
MTVGVYGGPYQYAGSGSQATFAYGCKIFAEEDLRVLVTGPDLVDTLQVLNVDYTVTGVGDEGGGNVVFEAGSIPAANEAVTINRVLPLTQLTDLRNWGPDNREVLEQMVDRSIMMHQQIGELLARVPRMREGLDQGGLDLTLPDPVAGAPIGFNDDGDGLTSNPSGITSAVAAAATAAAAEIAAEAARAAAEAAAAGVNLPSITVADADKLLIVKAAGDGYELTANAIESFIQSFLGAVSAEAARNHIKAPPALGHREGLVPRYKDGNEIYLGAGEIEIDGLLCALSGETAFEVDAGGALSANNDYFVGFSQPSSGNALSASEFIVTGTPPTYSASKRGFYDAGGAAIFQQFRTDGSGNVDPASTWTGPNGCIYSHSAIIILNDATPATSPEVISAGVHAWGAPVLCGGFASAQHAAAAQTMFIQTGGGATAVQLTTPAAAGPTSVPWAVTTNASDQIRHYSTDGTWSTYIIRLVCRTLPAGI